MANEKRLIDANDAEQVKKALAMCYKQGLTSECEGCGYKAKKNICIDALMEDALALINSLESCIDAQTTVDAVPVVRMPVRGYEEQYVVDQFGRVYGVDRTTMVLDNGRIYEKPIAGKQMKQSLHTAGYKTVTLTKNGKTKTVYVHRIVAEAFIENPDNLPMVNHKDEDKTNNFVENLEWCSASYNRTYGKGVEKQARQLRGKKHTEEHKRKISESVKKHHAEKDDFCSYGEKRREGE